MELKFFDTENFKQGLAFGSVSDIAAKQRMSVYHDALDNLETLRQINMKLNHFDDLNAVENMAPSTMGVALAEATLKGQINSIVGYVAIERSMTQMTQMLVYRDVITKAGANVMPMIGPDNPRERANKVYQANLSAGTSFSMTFDALVPGSIAITVKVGTGNSQVTYQMMDDRQGNILTQPGVLTAGTVNYETGAINMTFANAVAATDTIKICYQLNKDLAEGNNRTTIRQGYFQVKAGINKYEFETDLITAMISQKTVGGDVVAELQQSVTDERILGINNKLVETLKNNYVGNTLTIDLSAFSIESGFMDSLLKVLNTGLAAVDNSIAADRKSVV